MEQEDELNELLEAVGMEGKFQTKFNYSYNMALMLLVAMANINIILAITSQDHWCKVPGREDTNFTLQEWKEITIPREQSSGVGEEFSKCFMYNLSYPIDPNNIEVTNVTVSCTQGWEYDDTWYSSTIPSDENWVCDDAMRVPNVLTFSRVGEFVGTMIIGQLGDTIGRRPVLFFGIIVLLIGRVISVFTASQYAVFVAANILAGLQMGVVFQAPLIIGMEISSAKLRTQITLLQCVGWTGGMSIMPLIAWATGGDWILFTLITTLPCAVVFFVYRTFPESPRWLAMKGKTKKCLKVLQQIARENGTTIPANAHEVLNKLKGKQEKVYGLASIFANRQLFKNAVLLSTCLTVAQLLVFTLVLSIAGMSGNPFLNMFLQGLVELPAFLLGGFLCDRYGRRWSQAFAYLVSTILLFLCIGVVLDQDLFWLLTTFVLLAKFFVTVGTYCVYLQCMEIYPTCLRQTGTSLGVLVAMGMGSFCPYIIYLGMYVDVRYPYAILGALCMLGIICCLLLPETMNQRLPETIQDSAHFGKDQSFWYFPWRNKDKKYQPPTLQNGLS